jgi:hypothetical protein
MTQLYVLTGRLKSLNDENVDDENLLDVIRTMEGEVREKSINVAMYIRNLEATADAIKDAEGHMEARRKVMENRIASIKKYLLENMQHCGISKIECPEFVISLRSNPQKVVIDDQKLIPVEYMWQPETPPPEPDKKKMLEDMKVGVIIDGAHVEQSKRLEIK